MPVTILIAEDVDVPVAALREKLKGAAVQIQSVRGLGYKLVALDGVEAAGGLLAP